MRVTLTKKVGQHAKGSVHEVTPAVARRLVDRGVAKKGSPSSPSDAPAESDAPAPS